MKFGSCEVRKDIEPHFWKIFGQVSRAQQALKIAQNEVSGEKMFSEISLTFPENESVNGLYFLWELHAWEKCGSLSLVSKFSQPVRFLHSSM